MLLRTDFLIRNLVNNNTPPPLFFVSVDSEGFMFGVSCLESTLVRSFVSVAFKWVRAARGNLVPCISLGPRLNIIGDDLLIVSSFHVILNGQRLQISR